MNRAHVSVHCICLAAQLQKQTVPDVRADHTGPDSDEDDWPHIVDKGRGMMASAVDSIVQYWTSCLVWIAVVFFLFLCSRWSLQAHLHMLGMLWFMFFDINQLSLPTLFYSIHVSVSIFMALSTVFHSINPPDNSLLSHSILSLLFLPYWFCQLYILMKVFSCPDIIFCGWYCFCAFLLYTFLKSGIDRSMEWSTIPACPSPMCFFNRGYTKGTDS